MGSTKPAPPDRKKLAVRTLTNVSLRRQGIVQWCLPFFWFAAITHSCVAQIRVDATTNPYVSMVKLRTVADGRRFHGSGSIVGNRYLFTNAHNVHEKDSLYIYPGCNETNDAPFGRIGVKCERGVTTFYPDEFLGREGDAYDFAIVVLDKSTWSRVRRETNAAPLALDAHTAHRFNTIRISGYPVHRWFEFKKDRGTVQYENSTSSYKIHANGLIDYRMNARGGNSGSPLWIVSDDGRVTVIGLHKSGFGKQNQGVLLDAEKLGRINSWIEGNP